MRVRMIPRGVVWIVLALGAALLPCAGTGRVQAAEALTRGAYDQVVELVRPEGIDQLVGEIPWGIDLWQARRQAAAEGKPILLWEMDGHPLGCT
ncbi:MAG: hypothetical protein WD403_14140 [Pirellulales bacterium]